jgi:hypothetical protein
MSEREQMLGRMSVLEQERHRLRMSIEGLCRVIREEINPALSDPENMDIAMAAQQMRNLETAAVKLQGVNSQINRLKKELGLGS